MWLTKPHYHFRLRLRKKTAAMQTSFVYDPLMTQKLIAGAGVLNSDASQFIFLGEGKTLKPQNPKTPKTLKP
jgi:hypothetical protein